VDLFDNFVYAEPLKTKEAPEVLKVLKYIIKKNDLEKISTIGSDEGSEFVGNRKKLKDLGINLYILKGQHKAFQV
jgi:IS30 family transposase